MKNVLNASLVIIFIFFACDGKNYRKSKEQNENVRVAYTDSLIFENDITLEDKGRSKKSKLKSKNDRRKGIR